MIIVVEPGGFELLGLWDGQHPQRGTGLEPQLLDAGHKFGN
jgi:hypothetical protein